MSIDSRYSSSSNDSLFEFSLEETGKPYQKRNKSTERSSNFNPYQTSDAGDTDHKINTTSRPFSANQPKYCDSQFRKPRKVQPFYRAPLNHSTGSQRTKPLPQKSINEIQDDNIYIYANFAFHENGAKETINDRTVTHYSKGKDTDLGKEIFKVNEVAIPCINKINTVIDSSGNPKIETIDKILKLLDEKFTEYTSETTPSDSEKDNRQSYGSYIYDYYSKAGSYLNKARTNIIVYDKTKPKEYPMKNRHWTNARDRSTSHHGNWRVKRN